MTDPSYRAEFFNDLSSRDARIEELTAQGYVVTKSTETTLDKKSSSITVDPQTHAIDNDIVKRTTYFVMFGPTEKTKNSD